MNPPPKPIRGPARLAVDLYGYGKVARHLLPLLEKTGIRVATIRDSRGVRRSRPAAGHTRIFVDATNPRYEGPPAEAWVRQLEETLAGGTPVVTCNKAPLAIAFSRLADAARAGGTTISCSATVGGGTPVLLCLRRLEQCHGIARVEATLNATLGYVLRRVARGASIPEAVRGAQRAGWAEPDSALDLDGTDAYAKAVIIHNLLFPLARSLTLDRSRPRLRLEEARIRRLARSGRTTQALALISPGRIALSLSAGAGPAFTQDVGRVVVRASLRDHSDVFVAGPGAGPGVTAGALLGDLLALANLNGRTSGVLP